MSPKCHGHGAHRIAESKRKINLWALGEGVKSTIEFLVQLTYTYFFHTGIYSLFGFYMTHYAQKNKLVGRRRDWANRTDRTVLHTEADAPASFYTHPKRENVGKEGGGLHSSGGEGGAASHLWSSRRETPLMWWRGWSIFSSVKFNARRGLGWKHDKFKEISFFFIV